MKIEMEFQGLQELLKAFEDAASDAEIAAVNKRIVGKAEPIVKGIMAKKVPRSESSVRAHAADSVPIGKTRMKGNSASAEVGWVIKSDTSPYAYVKFINWGTIYQPPREFIYATGRDADSELQKIAEQEYQAFLDNTLK